MHFCVCSKNHLDKTKTSKGEENILAKEATQKVAVKTKYLTIEFISKDYPGTC